MPGQSVLRIADLIPRGLGTRVARRARRVFYGRSEGYRSRQRGIRLGPENFCYVPRAEWGVVVDVGVGHTPTFAPWIWRETNAFVVLCDPTPKHLPGLRRWVAEHPGSELIESAVTRTDGPLTFFVSDEQESGSIDATHANRSGPGREVTVDGLSIDSLLQRASLRGPISLVKLDLEGAEFDALAAGERTIETVRRVPQWLVEFHPAPQTRHTMKAVAEIAETFRRAGYRSFSRNGTDGLFYRD